MNEPAFPRMNPALDALLLFLGFAALVGIPLAIGGAAWAVTALAAFAVNMVVGCAAFAAMDDEQQSLLRWYRQAPSEFIAALVLQLWPVFAVVRWMDRRAAP
jgi:hypothetical protein